MKKYLLVELLILIFVIFLTKPYIYCYTPNKYIYIDPGHGGFDGGCEYKELKEKDITLKVSYYLKDFFEKSGYNVLLTRYIDKALSKTKKEDMIKRVSLINNTDTIIYLSIHVNYYPSDKINGAQVFYNQSSNRKLAEMIQEYLRLVDNNNRFAKSIRGKYLLENVNKAGCLIEIGFISGNIDYINLKSDEYLNLLAKNIYSGTLEYLSQKGDLHERITSNCK